MTIRHFAPSDLRAAAQLTEAATLGVLGITEAVHQAVWRSLGAPGGARPGQTRGLTGLVYRTVEASTELLGSGAQALLARLEPLLDAADQQPPGSAQREAVLAALNGVMGDRLLASANPLATPMTLRSHGRQVLGLDGVLDLAPIEAPARPRLLLLVHGLCMNDLQWSPQARVDGASVGRVDFGAALAARLDASVLALRYNSGRHTSDNGLQLAQLLEQLQAQWPVPLQEITLLTHSMGGLLARSAIAQAQDLGLHWPRQLKNVVFLGTPHHGAPLERAGHGLELLLGVSRFSVPFTRLAQLRSSGITDLRYGHVLEQDWHGRSRFGCSPDRRVALALPAGVACYAVAASTAARRSPLVERLLGDGLVPLPSALGQHPEAGRTLGFAKNHQWIAYRTDHMALQHSPAVLAQLLQWLAPAATP